MTQTLHQPALVSAGRDPTPLSPTNRCKVLGVGISTINMPLAVSTILRWAKFGSKHYVCVTGVHGVMESQRDPKLKQIHNSAGMVTPDGMPMVWMSRLHGFKNVSRVYGPDLMLAVFEASAALGAGGPRHYFYGGNTGVADLLAQRMAARFPGLQIAGTFCPPFRKMTEAEDREMVEKINAARPDIIWVGLSTPKQEYWMSSHLNRLSSAVLLGVGAAFDFHAGLKKQAPAWIQRNGLEWLFRLCTEPRRLWKRYLTNNPLFLWSILQEALAIKDFGGADHPQPTANSTST